MTRTPPPADDDAVRAAMRRLRPDNVVPLPVPAPPGPLQRTRQMLNNVREPATPLWPRSIAGLLAALWAAALSLLLVLALVIVAWVFAPQGAGSIVDVLRAGAAMWLLADGGAMQWQGATLSLAPLGVTAVILLLQRRAGAWICDAIDAGGMREALPSLAFAVAGMASAHLLVAATAANDGLFFPVWRNLLGSATVAALGLAWGVRRATALPWPEEHRALRTSVRGFVLALFALSTLVVLALLVVRRTQVLDVLQAVAGDSTSRVQVVLVCVAYLPTIGLWTLALLLGPGFTLGSMTSINLSGIAVGALPPIPLFALLPERLPAAAPVLLLVPLLVAIVAGRVVQTWPTAAASIAGTAVIMTAAALASAGGMGPGRLVQLGPQWWQVGLAAAGWMALGIALPALVRRARRGGSAKAGPEGPSAAT